MVLAVRGAKMGSVRIFCSFIAVLAVLSGATCERKLLQITAAQNYRPTNITVSSAPFDVIATPITPAAPYSQRDYQCNVTGDSRIPNGGSTFPLTVRVPAGQRVRVIFANGNLNGATITQQGEPGVIVQQGGSPIVQQAGGASPIVQPLSSPIIQQSQAPPAALVVQQSPTVVQQASYPQAQQVAQPPPTPVTQQPNVQSTTPASPPPATPPPPPPTPPPPPPPANTTQPATTITTSGAVSSPPTSTVNTLAQRSQAPQATTGPNTTLPATGRKLLQETVPGGPNNGQVEYVALASANTVPGFVVPNTQFGVPYIEFSASAAAAGQTASFKGVLEVAVVIGGVPQYPFRPNPRLSPECQVNVNFIVA